MNLAVRQSGLQRMELNHLPEDTDRWHICEHNNVPSGCIQSGVPPGQLRVLLASQKSFKPVEIKVLFGQKCHYSVLFRFRAEL
jgi:hypothetical protein